MSRRVLLLVLAVAAIAAASASWSTSPALAAGTGIYCYAPQWGSIAFYFADPAPTCPSGYSPSNASDWQGFVAANGGYGGVYCGDASPPTSMVVHEYNSVGSTSCGPPTPSASTASAFRSFVQAGGGTVPYGEPPAAGGGGGGGSPPPTCPAGGCVGAPNPTPGDATDPIYALPQRIADDAGSLVSQIAPYCFGLLTLGLVLKLGRDLIRRMA